MARLIFKLKSVPDDEADDIKNLLSENEIEFYESPAGNWEISMNALWLNDEAQYAQAKQLIDEYQVKRSQRIRLETQQKIDLGEHETTLINGEDCAYVIYDEKNVALCGIEEAYNQGEITFKKPVSCHLYPIRIKQYSEFAAVNYDKWEICDDACTLGKELQVPIYKFVKEALIRKFGEDWYSELEKVAHTYK